MTFVRMRYVGDEVYSSGGKRYDVIELRGCRYVVGEADEVFRIVKEDLYNDGITAVPIKNQKTLEGILQRYGDILLESELEM